MSQSRPQSCLDVKKLYENDINSVRTYERIQNLEELVLILADRDILPILKTGKEQGDVSVVDLVVAADLKETELGKSLLTNLDELSAIIQTDWKPLASENNIGHQILTGDSERDSAKKLIRELFLRWGQICEKEFYFRLKNSARNLQLGTIEESIVNLELVLAKNKEDNTMINKRKRRNSSDSETPDSFSFSRHKRDIEDALGYYRIIHDWPEFWKFLGRVEALHLSKPPGDVSRRISCKFNITTQALLKRVSTRHLTLERLEILVLIVEAFIAFKQSEKFNKIRKLRQGQKDLPVAAFEQEIVNVLAKDRVVIIAGDTGCGKSTQVPQFLNRGRSARVLCTQPRRLACISLAARLKFETLTEHSQLVGYQIRFEKRRNTDTEILFMTEGLLLRQLASDPTLTGWDVVILDEVHERHLHGDLLLGLLKCLLQHRDDLRLVLMSATINTQLFLDYFGGSAQIIQVPGRLFPVEVHHRPYLKTDSKARTKIDASPYLQVLQIIEKKHKGERGDVLIFLSGVSEITSLVDAIEQWALTDKSDSWIVLPLHGALALADQDKVFLTAGPGVRKCVVATNIAETSLTIDGIRFVVDSGKMKEMSYDPSTRVQRLKEFWVSKSSAEQRKGRAGRTGPGICFRIYSQKELDEMDDYPTPEVRRVPLDSVLLQVMAMGLPDVRMFPFVEPPTASDLEASIASLKLLDALTEDEKLTSTGRQLANLPVDVQVGKMLIGGCVFRQAELALFLAAILSVPNPLTHSGARDVDCERERADYESSFGDPVTLVALYRHWLLLKSQHDDSRRWARKCGLEEQRFYEVTKLRMQVKDVLTESGLLEEAEEEPTTSAERRIRSGELKLLKTMKAQAEKKPARKELRSHADDDELDIRDVDFRLRSDPASVAKLLKELDVTGRRSLVIMRVVFCSGLYPQFAVADEHNAHGADPVYHTKAKSYVFLHPSSYFYRHVDDLKIGEADIVIPNNGVKYTCRPPFSSKHQVLCYLGMLETTKVYLTSLLRMPAFHTCLLFCKQIDTSFDFSKIVCDGWLLFEPLYPEDAESFVIKVIELRKRWSQLVEKKISKSPVDLDTNFLVDELELFLTTDITYGIKRLLPADLPGMYTQTPDSSLEENPFNSEYKAEMNLRKGGVAVTDYMTYNCLISNEGHDSFLETEFNCPYCSQEFTMNALERVQHRALCSRKPKMERMVQKQTGGQYTCDFCQQEFSSSLQVLRHKKLCLNSMHPNT